MTSPASQAEEKTTVQPFYPDTPRPTKISSFAPRSVQDEETGSLSGKGAGDEILFVGQMGSEGRPREKVLGTEIKLTLFFIITNCLKGGAGQEVQRTMEE